VKVADIMGRIVHTVRAEDNLEVASQHMANGGVSLLPVAELALVEESHLRKDVVDKLGFLPIVEEEVLVGVITTRDIVVRAIAKGRHPARTAASSIMSQDFSCCQQDDDIDEALAIMEQHKVRRLFVLNSEKNVVGIVSRHDIWGAKHDLYNSGDSLPN
jgi:CBS domain-containing protein